MKFSFVLGMAIGAVIGGGGVYAALKEPWSSGDERLNPSQVDAGTAAVASRNGNGKRRGRRRRGGRSKRAGKEVGLQVIDERVKLSVADRKLSWKGPAVSLPPRTLDMSDGSAARSLNSVEISDSVKGGQRGLMSCIAEARGQAELAATITLKFLVGSDGHVGKLRVRAPTFLLQHGLYACSAAALRHMHFPATGASTLVTVPLDLSY